MTPDPGLAAPAGGDSPSERPAWLPPEVDRPAERAPSSPSQPSGPVLDARPAEIPNTVPAWQRDTYHAQQSDRRRAWRVPVAALAAAVALGAVAIASVESGWIGTSQSTSSPGH